MLFGAYSSVPVASSAALEGQEELGAAGVTRVIVAFGDCAGQMVKPLSPRSAPVVSNWVDQHVGVAAAKARLEKRLDLGAVELGRRNEYSLVVRYSPLASPDVRVVADARGSSGVPGLPLVPASVTSSR
jgi:hypothetical protein